MKKSLSRFRLIIIVLNIPVTNLFPYLIVLTLFDLKVLKVVDCDGVYDEAKRYQFFLIADFSNLLCLKSDIFMIF